MHEIRQADRTHIFVYTCMYVWTNSTVPQRYLKIRARVSADFSHLNQRCSVQHRPSMVCSNTPKMAVWYATLIVVVSTFLCFLQICDGETTVPWYESLPAVAMDYKVHIDPGKEDCYFQYVNPGATFYVSFQVSVV